jgi:anti-sigma factor RsiW
MDYEAQLKLQAYLDGELPEAEAREIAEELAREPGAAALLEELRQTRQALAGFEQGIRLPETREFYWSKIRRAIERQQQAAPAAQGAPAWLRRLRRFVMPATAVAFLALIGILTLNQPSSASAGTETALRDAGAFTYHDYASGTTLVWFAYPADNEVAGNKGPGTLQ